MIKYLNDLNLTKEQEQEFDKIRNFAFLCEMGSGFELEDERYAIDKISNIVKFERKIFGYRPDFYNGNDKIILCD